MPVRSVQVDGGSEFRKEFETACQAAGVPLHVLPPRRPDIDGSVERGDRTLRIEFRNVCRGELAVEAVNQAVKTCLDDYRRGRPHQALGWSTPHEYRSNLGMAA